MGILRIQDGTEHSLVLNKIWDGLSPIPFESLVDLDRSGRVTQKAKIAMTLQEIEGSLQSSNCPQTSDQWRRPMTEHKRSFDLSLPEAVDAEKGILGNILLDHDLIDSIAECLRLQDFCVLIPRCVFKAMQTLQAASTSIDPILIGEELKKEADLAEFKSEEAV